MGSAPGIEKRKGAGLAVPSGEWGAASVLITWGDAQLSGAGADAAGEPAAGGVGDGPERDHAVTPFTLATYSGQRHQGKN